MSRQSKTTEKKIRKSLYGNAQDQAELEALEASERELRLTKIRNGLSCRVASHSLVLFSYVVAGLGAPAWKLRLFSAGGLSPEKWSKIMWASNQTFYAALVLFGLALMAWFGEWWFISRALKMHFTGEVAQTRRAEEKLRYQRAAMKGARIWVVLFGLLGLLMLGQRDVISAVINFGFAAAMLFLACGFFFAMRPKQTPPHRIEPKFASDGH